jgi:hypothetical protein
MFPFTEHKENEYYIREFSKDVSEWELEWHWDDEDRIIESFTATDWQFQFDNELPVTINEKIFIPKGKIHRVIKGTTDLKLRVWKME